MLARDMCYGPESPRYLALCRPPSPTSPGRLCIASVDGSSTFAADASFIAIPGFADANAFSFRTMSATFPNAYLSLANVYTGSCGLGPPVADVAVVTTPISALATWTLVSRPT